LLQEIDLPPGDTVIGRSGTCHVTIEDPLVSRQHARLHVDGEDATIEDLGSRNGLMVNGRAIRETVKLRDGDRIRIGTQELVFCAVRSQSRPGVGPGSRPTGFMCHCATCGLPYPAELVQCPACGSSERMDEDTISGIVGDSDKNWTLELLVDVLHKAVSLERWDDVERMLRRSKGNVEERLAGAQNVEREHVDQLAQAASALAAARRKAYWGEWVLSVYAELGLMPEPDVTNKLTSLPPDERASLAPAAHRVIESARGKQHDAESLAEVKRLTLPPEE
jgi:hypothetical protein